MDPEASPPSTLSADAFAAVFQARFPLTVHILLGRTRCADLAEEIAQAAWAKGWLRRADLRDGAALAGWVNAIALNLFRNHVRPRPFREVTLWEAEGEAVDSGLIFDARRILGACTEAERRLLELFYLEGYTASEVGRQIGLKPVAVRVRLLRLRRRIESELAPPARS